LAHVHRLHHQQSTTEKHRGIFSVVQSMHMHQHTRAPKSADAASADAVFLWPPIAMLTTYMMMVMRRKAQKSDVMEPATESSIFRTPVRKRKARTARRTFPTRMTRMSLGNNRGTRKWQYSGIMPHLA